MADTFLEYLTLLDSIREKLEKLVSLAQEKSAAVQKDDLIELDRVMRQEQAMSLAFRGLEQKKDALTRTLGLTGVSLSELPGRVPEELRLQARQTVEALQTQFQVYRTASESTRHVLESNLHEIGKFLATQEQPPTGPGYAPPAVEPPKSMKSDFRA